MTKKPEIITCDDGFKFELVSAQKGLEIFKSNKEVFVLDSNYFESLIQNESEFADTSKMFAIEHK